jgi:hypothetical protein
VTNLLAFPLFVVHEEEKIQVLLVHRVLCPFQFGIFTYHYNTFLTISFKCLTIPSMFLLLLKGSADIWFGGRAANLSRPISGTQAGRL